MKIFVIALALALGACAQLDMVVSSDATAAAAYATANGDPDGAACASALATATTMPPNAGLLTKVEQKRVFSRLVENGACTKQAAQLLTVILNSATHGLAGFLPAS